MEPTCAANLSPNLAHSMWVSRVRAWPSRMTRVAACPARACCSTVAQLAEVNTHRGPVMLHLAL